MRRLTSVKSSVRGVLAVLALLALAGCRFGASSSGLREAAGAAEVPVQCAAKADAVKALQAQVAQQGAASTSPDCAIQGGSAGKDGTCRCADGTAVFKIHGKTCDQAGKSTPQNANCTEAGGTVGSDNTCRCADGAAVFKLHGQTCAQALAAGRGRGDAAGGGRGAAGAGGGRGGAGTTGDAGPGAAGGGDRGGAAAAGGDRGDAPSGNAPVADIPPIDPSLGLALAGAAPPPVARYLPAPGAVPDPGPGPSGLGLDDTSGRGAGAASAGRGAGPAPAGRGADAASAGRGADAASAGRGAGAAPAGRGGATATVGRGGAGSTPAQQLAQAQQDLQACIAGAGSDGTGGDAGAACVFCEKATGKVQSTCVPATNLAGCFSAFNTYYEKVAPGRFEARLMPGQACDQARAPQAVKGACVFIERATGALQATCAAETDAAGCSRSFQTYYEGPSPGKFEHFLVNGLSCADAQANYVAKAGRGGRGGATGDDAAAGGGRGTATGDGAAAGGGRGAATGDGAAAGGGRGAATGDGAAAGGGRGAATGDGAAAGGGRGTAADDGAAGGGRGAAAAGDAATGGGRGAAAGTETGGDAATTGGGGAGTDAPAPPPVSCWCGWSTSALCGVWKDNQLYYPYFGPIGAPYSCGDNGANDLCNQPDLAVLKAAVCQ